MKIGVPCGLMYYKYHEFVRTFFLELGAELIVSPNTNKKILDDGVYCCVDDACLPVKIFHGHLCWLKDRCDAIFLPRLIGIKEREYICPMFCGLNDMVRACIPGLPTLIDTPIRSLDEKPLFLWAQKVGEIVKKDKKSINNALTKALEACRKTGIGFKDTGYPLTIGLLGHAYNTYDAHINMDIKKKLNASGVGIVTCESVKRTDIDRAASSLFKKPFWTFAREYYGAAVTMCREQKADGIIYLSSFACGIDSVVTTLIKCALDDFPYMIIKLDEHTGQAGFDTRLEAFVDLLKRRRNIGRYIPQYGQRRSGNGIVVPGA